MVIVGMEPGRLEEKLRRPFVGPSGKLLDRAIDEANGRNIRRDAWITNAAICKGEGDREHDEAAACCAPRLYNELLQLPPEAPIFAMGKSAAKTVLNVRSILMTRGFIWTAKEIDPAVVKAAARKAEKSADPVDALKAQIVKLRAGLAGRIVLPMLHPAFVMRSDTWNPVYSIDMKRGIRVVNGELDPRKLRLSDPYEVVHEPERARRLLRKFGPVAGMDIETDGINPLKAHILCLAVADSAKNLVVLAGTRADAPESRSWRKREMAPVVNEYIRRCRTVVFHNGMNFDVIALERDGVRFPNNPDGSRKLEDTLIAHHTFASHLPQRMDQVVSEYCDSLPWKVVFGRRGAEEKGIAPHKMLPKELYLYNLADGQRQVEIWHAIQGDLEVERSIYDHDMSLAMIAKQMQVDGFYVDVERRNEIARKMKHRSAALKGKMRRLVKKPDFSPTRLNDVRWALFKKFRAPALNPTSTGLPSTSSATLEVLKEQDTRAGRLARLILNWRAVVKVKGTYIDAIEVDDNRARFVWRVFGTVSGRWSCRLQSAPRWSKAVSDRVREVYAAPPGCELIYFDLKQSEARIAAYFSGDEAFMKACEEDVHASNAKIIFPWAAAQIEDLKRDPKGPGKEFRDMAKGSLFGIIYSAEIQTVFQQLRMKGFMDVHLNDVQAIFDKVYRVYTTYYDYCEKNIQHCHKHGWMRSVLLGRIRWMGWNAKPGDIYNYPIQSGVADLVNLKSIWIFERLPKKARIVAQVHDALIIETPKGKDSTSVRQLIVDAWAKPIHVPNTDRSFIMPADIKVGDRWSSFG